MKGLFPEYDITTSAQYDRAWDKGLFVFDTSVLLNLYRYQHSTRMELLAVLDSLSPRIWIPYQVAVEFQRNRLAVIAEQERRFSQVRNAVHSAQKRLINELDQLQLTQRHALIDPKNLITGFDELVENFLKELDGLHKRQQGLTTADPLKKNIEKLFDGRVGEAPISQNSVDAIYKDAAKRFNARIPPGYADSEKGESLASEYMHRGIIYQRKYGDYVVWRQILEHAKSNDIKELIFVTDDSKEDWWHIVDANGKKTIGPRAELIDESKREGSLDLFLMYRPEQFLEYANKSLNAKISQDSLSDVRKISGLRSETVAANAWGLGCEDAILRWLVDGLGLAQISYSAFPDFIAVKDKIRMGFEVVAMFNANNSRSRLLELSKIGDIESRANNLSEFFLIVVMPNTNDLTKIVDAWRSIKRETNTSAKLIIGTYGDDKDDYLEFFNPLFSESPLISLAGH